MVKLSRFQVLIMSYSISVCSEPPDREQMTALLEDYYDLMIDRIEAMGGKRPTGGDAIAEFWDNIADYLPPKGALLLVQDEEGTLMGCSMLKSLGGGKGELKRLYVEPQLRGTGLGRKMIRQRLLIAREMGLSELMADTLRANKEMQGLYVELGFEEIPLDPDSTSYQFLPELGPMMLFYRISL